MIDDNAGIVLLRHPNFGGCTSAGITLNNCFETMAELAGDSQAVPPIIGWIWGTRMPTESTPLLVDIGPGEFGPFECNGGSDVSLRGSGREQSILAGGRVGVSVTDCDRLSFMNIGMRGTDIGVIWIGAGRSDWSDVDIIATGHSGGAPSITSGWFDACSTTFPAARSVHFFHGSRIKATGTTGTSTFLWAFSSACGESWFYGGDILTDVVSVNTMVETIHLNNDAGELFGELRVFGTTVRTRINAAISEGRGAHIYGGGVLHAHGSIFNTSTVPGLSADVDVVGIRVGNNATAHTPGTAFVLKPSGTGTAQRLVLVGSGQVDSPFLWQSGSTPPAVESVDGEDIFVETDCDATGNCNGGGNETHLMIYNKAMCGSTNPWFDSTLNACRVGP